MSEEYTATTTTVTTSRVTVDGRPYLDLSYLKTLPGIIKIIQASLDFICFICVVAGPFPGYGGAGWGTFVSIVAFIITSILLIMYLFHMIEMLHLIPWLLAEMFYCALWTFFYMIASCVLASFAARMRHVDGSSALGAFAEMVYCFAWTFFYLIASVVLAAMAANHSTAASYGAAAVSLTLSSLVAFFGFAAMIAYGFDTFLKFRSWRLGEVAQGSPPVASSGPA